MSLTCRLCGQFLPDAICRGCGKPFSPRRTDTLYCSVPCRARAYRRQRAAEDPTRLQEFRKREVERVQRYRAQRKAAQQLSPQS
jgi:hypothetical protein